jgi:small conductance mechanosensitive channel
MEALRQFWDSFRDGLLNSLPGGDELARFLIQLLKVAVIVGITLWVAQRAKTWAARLLGRARVPPNVIALLGNGVFVLAILFGLSWLLAALGATWTAVLASLSVVTLAFGLALQDLLKNFVAGVYILLEQPFKIGDQVVVKGVGGAVEGVDIRTTVLRTEEGLRVLVPNNVVFTEIVTNRSAYDTRRVALQLVDARVDFNDLSRLVNDALAPFEAIVRTPAPKATIQKVNNGTATIGVEYWQRGAGADLSDVIARLKERFPEATITVTMADGLKVGAP